MEDEGSRELPKL